MIKSKSKTCFQVSGHIVVTDPCYECGEASSPAVPGRWVGRAFVSDRGDWGRRVASVVVHHESWDPTLAEDVKTTYIGVDSGQAGVFDSDTYEYDHELLYDECCEVTSGLHGYVEGGWVSSSGYGDGGYKVKIYRVCGKASAVEITFLPE
jgi:hypothetical protein